MDEALETTATPDNETQLTTEGLWLRPFPVAIDLPDGDYPATAIVQSFSPLELIFGVGQTADVNEVGTR